MALLQLDYTSIGQLAKRLPHKDPLHVRAYLLRHPAFVKEAFRKVALVEANKSAYRLFGAKSPKNLRLQFQKVFLHKATDLLIEQVIAFLSGEGDFSGEFQYRAPNRRHQDIFLRSIVPDGSGRSISRVLVTLQDITNWKKLERQLRRRAQVDSLTNLLNHSTIMQGLEQEVIRAKRYGLQMSCMMVDLDFFKVINDKFGHQRGDQILKRVSKMIKNCFRRVDIIGRYGGDEFLVILPETKPAFARYAALRLQKTFAKTFFSYRKALSFHITLSIGIAGYPSKRVRDAKDLVALADKAMYACKAAGRNRIETA